MDRSRTRAKGEGEEINRQGLGGFAEGVGRRVVIADSAGWVALGKHNGRPGWLEEAAGFALALARQGGQTVRRRTWEEM